ncbi:MAG: type VI secretion system baseplate subunit TssG [Deltaproteobacteria bacterium]|jgi:type VI secretion system ImpH/TssG family protein|nr:type VI secretion system baseplate subunit TssG [Deltaproteobacteria bacterium]
MSRAPETPRAPGKALSLEEELLARPGSFSYFQAIRVIRQARTAPGGSMSALVRRGIKIRADTSLGFPGADLVRVERLWPSGGPVSAASPAGAESVPPGGRLPPGASPGARETAPPVAPGIAPGPPAGTAPDARPPALPDILDGGGPGYGEYPRPLYRLTVTFMGLYGAASPLPPFYAQEILQDELNDESATRELFDLISLSSYRSHALAYFYSLLPFSVLELKDPAARGILFALMGEEFREEARRDDFRELRLFSTKIRSAGGLMSLLRSTAPGVPLELEECVPRWVAVPPEQRGRLRGPTARLGRTVLLGGRARDLGGKFRLRAVAKDLDGLEGLMPGGKVFGAIRAAVDRYLEAPLVWDLEIRLPRGAAEGVVLGARRGRLGLSAFLAPEKDPGGQYVFNRVPEGAHV